MPDVIIYNQDNGVVAIIIPAPEFVAKYGLHAIAQKDVPAGKPYKIIGVEEMPADKTLRDAWTVDESHLIDGIGHVGNTFEEVLK